MNYTVDKGIVRCASGIPEAPRWFSDSRLSVQFDGTAITRIDYCNPAPSSGNHTVFLQRLWSGIRYFLERNKVTCKPEYTDTALWPFGVEAEWEMEGARFRHRLLTVAEAIVIQIETPASMPADLYFKLEMYKDFGLIPADRQDLRFSDCGKERSWQDWTFEAEKNLLCGSFTESPIAYRDEHGEMNINSLGIDHDNDHNDAPAALHIGIGADFPLQFRERPLNTKYIVTSEQCLAPGKTYSFIMAFAGSKQQLVERHALLTGNIRERVAAQFARYRKVADSSPVLDSPYKELNDFISLVPLYHESCKVTDWPGAIKAKTTDYWVWGWDGMTSNYAALYWGDASFIRDMLRFYENTADPRLGIGHCFRNDMKLYSAAALPSQGMYMTLLHQYAALSGDADEIKERFPFARRIFERMMMEEVRGTGLCAGASLFPDFPNYMHETGSDISSLNNTILYCAARSMEALSEIAGDREMRDKARAVFAGIEQLYLPLFFDKERRFVVSSIDAHTMEKRNSFNSNAVKWENHYCRELMEAVDADCLDFFERHIVCKAGLREIPVWSDAFDMDANQLHCWWPVTGEYYMQLINGQDRPDLIRRWIGWVSYWTGKLTIPEGISCYVDTDEPELDRWNTSKGTWQAYSMRGWYQAALHGVVGVDIDAGGMTFHPYSGEEMTLSGLHYRGRKYNLSMKGSGPYIDRIEADGVMLAATCKLPVDIGEGAGDKPVGVTVFRAAENRHPVYIRHAYGLDLRQYRCEDGIIHAVAAGAGTCRLKLGASRKPIVRIDGIEVDVRYDEAAGEAIAQLDMPAGKRLRLEIKGDESGR